MKNGSLGGRLSQTLARERIRVVTVNKTVKAKLFLNSKATVRGTNPTVVLTCFVTNVFYFFVVHTVNRLVLSSLSGGSFVRFMHRCLNPHFRFVIK